MKKFIPVILSACAALASVTAGYAATDESALRSPAVQQHPAAHAPQPGPDSGERLQFLLLARELLLEQYDSNRDGQLDDSEKAQLVKDADKAKNEARMRFIKRFDRNGDGKLSKGEVQEMRKVLKRERHDPAAADPVRRMLPPGPPRDAKKQDKHEGVVRKLGKKRFEVRPSVVILMQGLVLRKYDANRNGRIDPDEYTAIRRDAATFYAKKTAELMALYDRDGDGKLDDTEKQAVRDKQDGQDEGDAAAGIQFDDIDLFLRRSFEEELMEMLEQSIAGEDGD